jgi:protein-tyrosine phosphatase
MAEAALAHPVAQDDVLRGRVDVSSAGTANWHVGRPIDPRARRALDRAGIDRVARPGADRSYLSAQDLVVVMTREHHDDVRRRLTSQATEVIMLRNLMSPGPGPDLDVADPYYGGDREFDECLDLLRECCRRLTSVFRQRLDAGSYEV